jgi:membrane protease YdiL (CAAX protease family)
MNEAFKIVVDHPPTAAIQQRYGFAVTTDWLDHPIPGGARWAYIWGSVLVGCITLQAITGWALMAYYAPSAEPLPGLLTTNVLDLVPTEFIYRGFLMLALARVFGPIALVIALFPFTFAHLTKPEAELLSTFAGGAVYGWLTWRTRSVLWGALAHVYIVTLIIVAAGGSGLGR